MRAKTLAVLLTVGLVIGATAAEWPVIAAVVGLAPSAPICPAGTPVTSSGGSQRTGCLNYLYAVSFTCGNINNTANFGVEPGDYQTLVAIHNPSLTKTPAAIVKKFVNSTVELKTFTAGNPQKILPTVGPNGQFIVSYALVEPDASMRITCFEIEKALLPTHISPVGVPYQCTAGSTLLPDGECPLIGYVILYSNSPNLNVLATYTAAPTRGGPTVAMTSQSIPAQIYVP